MSSLSQQFRPGDPDFHRYPLLDQLHQTLRSVIRRPTHNGSVPNNPANDDVHPELRRAARFAPRQLVGRRTYRLIRALSALRPRPAISDAEVITLGSGGARPR